MRRLRRATAALGAVLALAAGLLAFPDPLFSASMRHGQFIVRSDRPVDPAMARVLDDSARRLRTSELYDARATFRIFICNEPWRMWLYSRNAALGGSADTLVTRNIYLREADIAANRIVPPGGILADADARPLSYFIAHEAAHVMQARVFGRLLKLRYPAWLVEGYADWVAKAGDFDIGGNRRLLRRGDPRLDYARSGLYRRYHLMVATQLRRPGATIRRLFADPPDEEAVIRALLRPEGRP